MRLRAQTLRGFSDSLSAAPAALFVRSAAGFLTCHCEAPQEPWQSRRTGWNTGRPRRIRKCLLEIATSGLRPPRNDTGGERSRLCHCAPPDAAGLLTCHCEAPQEPWRPEREARGSALGVQSRSTQPDNRVLPAKSQLPSRDCHVASLLAMTRQVVPWCISALLRLNCLVQGAHYPQGARRIRKAAKPPTAAQGAPLQTQSVRAILTIAGSYWRRENTAHKIGKWV